MLSTFMTKWIRVMIYSSWGRTEEKILMAHLYEIALRDEFREAALLVQSMEGEIMI